MPDWSYRTFVDPIFRTLPDDIARRFAVACFQNMSRLPQGFRIVDAMGHMGPSRRLARDVYGTSFPSPLGLAPVIDPEGKATAPLSRFGFGFLTVGPVGLEEPETPMRFEARRAEKGIVAHGTHAMGVERARNVRIDTPGDVRLLFELHLESSSAEGALAEAIQLIERLGPSAHGFVLSPRIYGRAKDSLTVEVLSTLSSRTAEHGAALFVGVPVDTSLEDTLLDALEGAGVGLFLSGRASGSTAWIWDETDRGKASQRLRSIREDKGDRLIVGVDGGVTSPREARELVSAGADLLLLGSGIVHTGPGLPKRCNEALAPPEPTTSADQEPHERRAWFWGFLLGVAMLIGSIIAVWVALTDVLMPYDEEFLGRTRNDVESFNPRILHFMTHDRITLAGTMVSTSVLYLALSLCAMRTGHHWAQRALTVSAAIGFLTFFSFLGFGFFDPFHGFVALVLLQLMIQAIVRPLGAPPTRSSPPLLDNDAAWKQSQWGQLLFVVQAVGLIVAGATIMGFGMTSVFVPEDIEYLQMPAHTIRGFDPELTPLIAHDRATFGGMLIAAGIGLLLTTLWSFRRGDRWLWWTYLLTILPPYLMTLWIHADIGYMNQYHLSPVYIGIGLLLLGLVFSARHLLSRLPVEDYCPPATSRIEPVT
ncbi:MAG: hypothetical protein AAF517_17200 [Planctomycetota bacterium]